MPDGQRGVRLRVSRWLLTGLIVLAGGAMLAPAPGRASPWVEVGDAQLRSDIQLLAAAGVINNITTQWPLPWAGILESLSHPGAVKGQPANVRAAIRRVLDAAHDALQTHHLRSSASLDVSSASSVVRGYDAMGREKAQVTIYNEVMTDNTAIRLAVGGQLSDWSNGQTKIKFDDSYIAHTFGGTVFYAGYLTHWWGPGWISALGLSNNARPFPQIGLQRLSTKPFSTPLLSWLGPWQAEFLVGLLDGPRTNTNTLYSGLRFTFSPLPGLELSAARTEEFCGEKFVAKPKIPIPSCKPIANYFNFTNSKGKANNVNDEGEFSIHYTGMAWGMAYEVYMQLMNEDSNPITHSATSHLFGASIWVPFGDTTARITAEYTDSIATRDIFSFGDYMHGSAYNNSQYVDGMRYRGRTLGFSLDSDSRLESLQISWNNDRNWTYTLTYHHAAISTVFLPVSATTINVVTTSPVKINLGEARVRFPLSWASFELAARVQDDQPRPDHGFLYSFETAINVRL